MLCAVGDLLDDVVVWLSGPIGGGTDTPAQVFHRRGGSAANVAAFAAGQRRPARFVGHVGDDHLGERLLGELAGEGVELCVQRGGRTGTVVVLVEPGGERTMLTDRGSATDLAGVPASCLDDVAALHLTSYALIVEPMAATARGMAAAARAAGASVSLDASSVRLLHDLGRERFEGLLAELRPDVLLANAAEAAFLGLPDRLPEHVALAVVKRGGASTLVVRPDGATSEVPVPPIDDVSDTTGAGDAFAAGFLGALLDGADPHGAVVAGHELAAAVLGQPGATLAGGLSLMLPVAIEAEVAAALADGRAVVALESTIFSNLGLPSPANAEALGRCLAAVRRGGAVPAVTAVLDGVARLGLAPGEHERILGPARKAAERDLAVAVAQRWPVGATTVSASVALAHLGGVAVFATGGIGGVHRGASETGDVSADLDALARHPVVTVCAGAKVFLDLARTLEELERIGVPVLGWRHDWFPAFYTRSSGLRVPHRVERASEVAAVLGHRVRPDNGVLVAVPIPEDDELDPTALDAAVSEALAEAAADGVTGPGVTPFVLARIAGATEGRSVPANLALAEHNAGVAAEIAVAVASGT